MRNKFVSVFLAFLMIIGSIYAVPTAHALSTTNTDGVTLRKTASLQLDQLNRWTIDLELEFKPIVKSQDIVIVFDKSGSMDSNSRLENAKTAAKDFTDILLNTADGPHNNKIALVTFSGGYWEAASFTSNATSLKNKIEDIDANGGTFTQGGLKKARDMLASSNADNKIIVLLTDGLPTYGFGLSAAGKTKYDAQTPTTAYTQNSYRETIITHNGSEFSTGTQNYEGGRYNPYNIRFIPGSVEKNFLESDFNYTLGSGSSMGGSGSQAMKLHSTTSGRNLNMINLFNTNIAEAKIVKGKGITLYTVPLDLGGVANAEATLKEMATSAAHYFPASSSDLGEHFADIANTLRFPFTDMSIYDPMGVGLDLEAGTLSVVTGSSDGLSSSNNVINWNLTPDSFTYIPQSNTYKLHLRYTVKTNMDAIPLVRNHEFGQIDANGAASFKYKLNGQNKSSLFPVPKVQPTILQIYKTLLDENGNEMSLSDSRDQREYVYTLTDGATTHTASFSGGPNHYYIPELRGGKNIEEINVVNDNIERYIRSTYHSSDYNPKYRVTDGNFTLKIESGINLIQLVNQVDKDFDPDFELSKQVTDASGDILAEKGEILTYTINLKNNSNGYIRDLFIKDTLGDVVDYINSSDTKLIISRNGTIENHNYYKSNLMSGFALNLAKDDIIKITFDVTVREDVELPDYLQNTVIVKDKDAKASIKTGVAIISSVKSVVDENADGFAEAGETLNYTISFTNSGTVGKSDLYIEDTLAELLPYIDYSSANIFTLNGTSYPLSRLINGFETYLPRNTTHILEFSVKIKDDFDATSVTKLHNLAIVGDTTPETEIPTAKPDITATKDVADFNNNGFAEPGEDITYSIIIKNGGKVTKSDLFVQDTLSSVLGHLRDDTYTFNINGITRPLQDLVDGFFIDVAPNETITIAFTLTVDDDIDPLVTPKLLNLATIGDDTPDVEIPTGKAVIAATKDVMDANEDGFAEAGESLNYTITIKNTGNVKKEDLSVQDTLSTLLPHIDDTTGIMMDVNGTSRSLKDLIDGFLLDIDTDETIIITFTVRVKDSLDTDAVKKLHNLATIGTETPDVDIPTGKATITVAKDVRDDNGNDFAEANETLFYTILITNTGVIGKEINVRDTLEDLLAYINDTTGTEFKVNDELLPLQDLVDGFITYLDAKSELLIEFEVTVINDLTGVTARELINTVTVDDLSDDAKIDLAATLDVVIPPPVIPKDKPTVKGTALPATGYVNIQYILGYTFIVAGFYIYLMGKRRKEKN